MEHDELQIKIRLCKFLGIRPLFAVRMLPKSWIKEVWDAGGYSMILKYQLYPPYHRDLAKRIERELGFPVDTPKSLADATIERFLKWHKKKLWFK